MQKLRTLAPDFPPKPIKDFLEKHLVIAIFALSILIAVATLSAFRYFYQVHGAKREKAPVAQTKKAGLGDTNASRASVVTSTPSAPLSAGSPTTTTGSRQPQAASAQQAYVPSSCIRSSLPFSTNYVTTASLAVGDAVVSPFADGYTVKCKADSNGQKPNDSTVPAANRTVYVGTGGASVALPLIGNLSLDGAYAQISCSCGPVLQKINDNTAYQLCISSVMKQLGY